MTKLKLQIILRRRYKFSKKIFPIFSYNEFKKKKVTFTQIFNIFIYAHYTKKKNFDFHIFLRPKTEGNGKITPYISVRITYCKMRTLKFTFLFDDGSKT